MIEVSQVMTRDVRLVDPATTLKEAAAMMRDGDFGLLPIGENDRLVGTITDRDIAIRAVADTPLGGLSPEAWAGADRRFEQVLEQLAATCKAG